MTKRQIRFQRANNVEQLRVVAKGQPRRQMTATRILRSRIVILASMAAILALVKIALVSL